MAQSRVEDRRREAADATMRRAVRARASAVGAGERAAITIRLAMTDDALALDRLAQFDSAGVPPDPVLIAEVDRQARAALSLRDGSTVADPFHHTEALLELLVARADHLRGGRRTRARRARRLIVRAFARAQ